MEFFLNSEILHCLNIPSLPFEVILLDLSFLYFFNSQSASLDLMLSNIPYPLCLPPNPTFHKPKWFAVNLEPGLQVFSYIAEELLFLLMRLEGAVTNHANHFLNLSARVFIRALPDDVGKLEHEGLQIQK